MDPVIDKRQRIIAAASRLIVRNGLQCSMQAIAEEAGVATGSLYNYFASKEALVRGVYGRVATEMTERVIVAADLADDPAQIVRDYFVRYLDFIWEDALRARLFDYLDNTPLLSLGDAKAIFGPFVEQGIGLIAEAQRAGVVRDGSPALISSFARGAIRNALKRHRTVSDTLDDGERALIIAMCWQALAA